jgi:hypothetical protein
MTPTEELVGNFQELVAQVPELVQPFVVMLAGTIPFLEGEAAALIGIAGGLNPVLAAIAAAAGNFLCVLLVVALTSRARTAVVDRRSAHITAAGAPDGALSAARPESKGRQRFKRWLLRFGVPGASILGPLAIPTQFTSAMLVAGGTPRAWVLLWQAVAIVLWTTVAAVAAWAALTFLVGV